MSYEQPGKIFLFESYIYIAKARLCSLWGPFEFKPAYETGRGADRAIRAADHARTTDQQY